MTRSKQADLDAGAEWYAGPDDEVMTFTSLRAALVYAMEIPQGHRARDAMIVTAGAERYGWDAIELLHQEAKTAGKL